jgi:hypothetical protein
VAIETTPKGMDPPSGRTQSTLKSFPAEIDRRHYVITLYYHLPSNRRLSQPLLNRRSHRSHKLDCFSALTP